MSTNLQVDGESHKGRVIYYPPKLPDSPGSRMSSAGIQRESMVDMKQQGKILTVHTISVKLTNSNT